MDCRIDELGQVFLEPRDWWRLELSNRGEIRPASAWNRSFQWLGSFFGDSHKVALQNRVIEIISKEGPINPEMEIALEKIGRLAHSQNSWLYDGSIDLSNPPEARVVAQQRLESAVKPFEEGGRYYNQPGEKIWSQFLKTLYLLFPGALSKASDEDLMNWNRVEWKVTPRSIEPKITWLGHAGLLIQGENMNLLFDPSFAFVGPCFLRHTPPPIPFEKLPLIDVVGISHNHGDHFDRERLAKLGPLQPFAFVPEKLDEWFVKNGFEKVEGAKWWKQTTLERSGRKITLTALPAWHGSQTTVSDLNKTLWMGFLIEINGTKIYFAGDTAYNKEMLQEIKRHFGTIDVACLPIAPEEEREVHFDSGQALDAFEFLGAKRMIPVHHGAYRMGTEKIEDPLNLFLKTAEQRGLLDQVVNLKLGETCDVAAICEEIAL